MRFLILILVICILITVISIRIRVAKSERSLMILGGSFVSIIVIAIVALAGWGIWVLIQAQL